MIPGKKDGNCNQHPDNVLARELSPAMESLLSADALTLAISNINGRIVACTPKFQQQIIEGVFRSDQRQLEMTLQRFRSDAPAHDKLSINSEWIIESVPIDETGKMCVLWIASHLSPERMNARNGSLTQNSFEYLLVTGMDHRIRLCNKLFALDLDYSSIDDVVGKPLPEFFANHADYFTVLQQLAEHTQVSPVRSLLKTSHDKRIPVMINCSEFTDDFETVLHWSILDITEAVAIEESLKLKHKELEKLNAIVEKFLYSTSHDLRSPVASILGLVNLIRIEHREELLYDYVKRIEESASKLDMIIKNLLNYSKTSYQRSQTERIDLEGMLHQIIQRYRDENNFKIISFDLRIAVDVPFYSDVERIELIIDNLLRNAIHFSDRNKLKSIVRIQIHVDDKLGSIEVLDNGQGIGKEHLGNVFNMFYKAGDQSKGAGLGLFIVKESVHQLDGTITVESELGFGSIFRVNIPNRKNPAEN